MRTFVFSLFAATALLLWWQHGLGLPTIIAILIAITALLWKKLPKASTSSFEDGGPSAPDNTTQTGPVSPEPSAQINDKTHAK